jgi:transposase
MRYPDRGGLSMKARADREALRFAAAEMFERGVDVGEIAWRLAVTRKSVNEWKRAWRSGGVEALASKGPGGAKCRLDEVQLKILEQVLDEGPAARGWTEDQRWTLARVATLIFELFKVKYTLRGVSYLLHRLGWTPQVPQHVAAERDEEKVATWRRETWPQIKGLPPGRRRGSASSTRPGRACARPRPGRGPGAGTPRRFWCRARARAGCPWRG